MEYEILSNAWTRGMLKSSIRKVVDFARKKNVSAVVAVERKGRPVGLLFAEAWKALYPEVKPPKLFFLSRENPLIAKHALENPDAPMLVLDNSVSTGITTASARGSLQNMGAKKIFAATLTSRYGKTKGVDLIAEGLFRVPWAEKPDVLGVYENEYRRLKSDSNPNSAKLRKELAQLASELRGS